MQGPHSKADSGWVQLFNGKDHGGLYIRTGGGILQDPDKQASFQIKDSTLFVPKTGGVGHVATRTVYSRYQVRVQYRYGKGQTNPNAGLLYHIDSADYAASDAGAFLGIMNIWVTADTKGDANHTWQAGGMPYTAVPSNDLSPRRIYRSQNAAPNDTDWVLLEGLIYGSDSVVHRVNGTVVMRGRNLMHNRKTVLSADEADRMPMDRGHIGLQTEGAEVSYRNWELRRLRADGTPLIPGCTNPSASNYSSISNQDDGSCKGTSARRDARTRQVTRLRFGKKMNLRRPLDGCNSAHFRHGN